MPNDTAITVQIKTPLQCTLTESELQAWGTQTLHACNIQVAELTLRFVGHTEGSRLNKQYRHKKGPTNVLSFVYENTTAILGDIVICVPVVVQEAYTQQKSLQAHFAHMVVHGILHILGYDHETEAEAKTMQSLENKLLTQFGFSPPYRFV